MDALSEQEQLFLYDDRRHLMAIGYNVDERTLDPGHYDLLASEARLGIFTAIARGQLPQESWFALGRLLTAHDGDPVLMSWSGSMFEYLMPPLIMPNFEQTLLQQTCHAAVRRQIDYGRERGRALGHLGVRLQRHRHRAQLPIPCVRRAGARVSSAASATNS